MWPRRFATKRWPFWWRRRLLDCRGANLARRAMLVTMRNRVLPVLTCALASIAPCFGWGRTGHQLVAKIASQFLNPRARTQVASLLGPDTMESIASWADEIRAQRKETGPWHFIDIPITVRSGQWETSCPSEGCIVRKTDELVAFLRSGKGTPIERTEALKFLVHFLGDMHQPLHCGENHDRGGNDVPVVFHGKPTNLHSIWDVGILEQMVAQDPGFLTNPLEGLGWWTRWRMRHGTVPAWAWKSHDVSRDVVYGKLSPERPAPVANDYIAAASPVIHRQIQMGGVRLAAVLNSIWK
jgi:hypothetical protein